MQSKVKKIHSTSEWKWQNWTMFSFEIEMENGDKWKINSTKPDGINEWMEFEYDISDGKYGKVIKKIQKAWSFSQKWWSYQARNPKIDFISFAMSYAKDLVVWWKIEVDWLEISADIIYQRMIWKIESTDAKNEQHKYVSNMPSTDHQNPWMISEKQVAFAASLWGKTGLTEEQRKMYLKKKYDVESSKDLSKEQAKEFIDDLQTTRFAEKIYGSHLVKEDDLPF